MSIIDFGISRSRTVLSMLFFILVAGFIAFVNIPKESDPDVNIPIIYVSLHHKGISPEDSEKLLIRPIENELRNIAGVKEMRSTAYEGGGNIVLEFDAGFNADLALTDVREKVDLAKADLPEDTDEPTVNEVNLSAFPVLTVALSGNLPEQAMLNLALNLKSQIEALPTVLEVSLIGDREEVVEIIISPQKIESYNLDMTALFSLVSRSNQVVAAGTLGADSGRFSIKVPGLIEGLDDILSLPLKIDGDTVIQLKDLATIRKTFKDTTNYARINGEPTLVLEVSKRSGENIISTINAIRTLTQKVSEDWPNGIRVTFSQDKSDNIRQMLGDLQNNITSAVLLVLIVAIAILGVRAGILIGIAIPGSFLTAILLLSLANYTINVVVLFALILAVGMLVDGAIVVTEFADRKISEGATRKVAYATAAKRMARPIIASTATTLAAFMPLIFWPGIVGEFMKFLPITLTFTLVASLAMALFFIPVVGIHLAWLIKMLANILLTAVIGFGVAKAGLAPDAQQNIMLGIASAILCFYPIMRLVRMLGNYVLAPPKLTPAMATVSSGAPIPPSITEEEASNTQPKDKPTGPTKLYLMLLALVLRFPKTVLILAFSTLIGAWFAYANFGKGVEFFPKIEPDRSIVNIHARGNLSASEMDRLVADVEAEILAMQAERGEFLSIYTRSGIIATRGDEAEDIIGRITLEYKAWDVRRKSQEIRNEIEARTQKLAGIRIETLNEESGPPSGKPIHIELAAADPRLIEPVFDQVLKKLQSVEEIKDIEDSRSIPGIEWKLEIDRSEAAKYGADITLVGNFIQMLTKGFKISDYRPFGSEEVVDIVVRYPEEFRNLAQMDHMRVTTPKGAIAIGNFVDRSSDSKTGLIRRSDSKRIMFIKADVAEGVVVDNVVKGMTEMMETLDIPASVTVKFRGDNENQKEAQEFLVKAFGIALFIMALILVTQFNSFYSAGLILSAVVMSTIGVMLGLLIIEEPFGIVMSGIGVVALAGIVVNNNIVLIDTFDYLKQREKTIFDAILKTGAQRFRPVMLTTITTILGLLPMVFQVNIDFVTRAITTGAPSTQWWVQLSTAIVFGLGFSTLLTLLVTPAALMLRANKEPKKL